MADGHQQHLPSAPGCSHVFVAGCVALNFRYRAFQFHGRAACLGQIFNPSSGRPIEGYRTLSVSSPSAIDAEVLSTALLITPEQDRARLLASFKEVLAVEIVYNSATGGQSPRIEWKYGF